MVEAAAVCTRVHGISGVKEVACNHICVDKNILSFKQCFFPGYNCNVATS